MNLSELFADAHIQLDVVVHDADQALEILVRPLSATPSRERLLTDLRQRHRLLPCALGSGIALPDTINWYPPERAVSVIRVREGVQFGAEDRIPVRLLFGVFGPQSFVLKGHLRIVRRLNVPGARDLMLAAATADEFLAAVIGHDHG